MEQIGSEYNFKTGGSIKALNDLIAKVEELDKQVNKLGGDTQKAGDGLNNLPKKTQGAVKGFDALGNSINQVTREFPAFAFSAQTGFLAVSNNIPILLDSINQLKVANQQLAAEGKATIPVFKQIISSLFSWQTALSLLISFSVLYGKEIGNFIANMFSASDAVDILKLRVDALNKAYDSKELKSGIQSIIELKRNIELAKDGYINKESVLKSYNEQYGKVLGTTNDINVAEKKLVDATPTLIKALIARAASANLVAEASQTLIDIQKKRAEVEEDALGQSTYLLKILETQREKGLITEKEYLNQSAKIIDNASIEAQKKAGTQAAKELVDLENKYKKQVELATDFGVQSEKVLKGTGINGGDSVIKSAIQILQEELKKTEDQFQSAKLDGLDTTKIEAKFKSLTAQLEKVLLAYDELTGVAAEKRAKEFKETQEAAFDDIEKAAKEFGDFADKDLKKRREAEKKAIKDGILDIELQYAKQKEGKILSTTEELELERGKQLAIISLLNQYKEQNNEVQNDILERTIKLNEVNYKINKQTKDDEVKNTKQSLEEELQANRKFYIDKKNLKDYSAQELAQLDIIELESQLNILKDYQAQGLDVNKQILDAEEALQNAKTALNKKGNKDRLKDDKEAARQQRELLQASAELGATISNGYFDLRHAQLQDETSIQIQELEKQKEAKVITEEEYNTKRNAILNDQALKQRELNLSEIKVQTALAIIRAFATGLTPFDRILNASLAAAQGLAQYAFASAQPLPRFAKGTDRVIGGTKGQDSVHALLMPDEAVIPTKENMARPGLAKAWINGNLDSHLMMNYIKPAIDENNKKWEAVLKVNQNSTFIRNDNFSDRKIVKELRGISRRLNNSTNNNIVVRKNRNWN